MCARSLQCKRLHGHSDSPSCSFWRHSDTSRSPICNDKHRHYGYQTWTPTPSEQLIGKSFCFQMILRVIITGYRLNCILFITTECFSWVTSVINIFPWGRSVHALQFCSNCIRRVQWPGGTRKILQRSSKHWFWRLLVLDSNPSSAIESAHLSTSLSLRYVAIREIIEASSSFELLWDHVQRDEVASCT